MTLRELLVAKREVRAQGVVVPRQLLDHGAGFLKAVEHPTIEEFVPQIRVEALAVPVLLLTARLDIGGSRSDCCDPVLHRLVDELRSHVRADMSRDPSAK